MERKYVALDDTAKCTQSCTGTFKHIAAGADGSLYVIFEETVTPANQHVVVGTLLLPGKLSMSDSLRGHSIWEATENG